MERQRPWYQQLKQERDNRNWTQKDVATKIGCETKTVGRWENAHVKPGYHYKQKLIELFDKDIFKDFIDQAPEDKTEKPSLPQTPSPGQGQLPIVKPLSSDKMLAPFYDSQTTIWKEDWGEAPSVDSFYGREKELDTTKRWITQEGCRIVAVLGIGGVGKTSFATTVAQQIQYSKQKFEYIVWRSLQNAPPVENILQSCLQILSGQQRLELPFDLDGQISLLLSKLREHHCLLTFDNVESILQAGQRAGVYSDEFKGYGRLFQRIGDSQHNSCLILTSREKPKEIGMMEGDHAPVRSLFLSGVGQADGQKLLQDKGLHGSQAAWADLMQFYAGNPLALKLIAEPIREIFGGDIAEFFQAGEMIFDDVSDLLDQQFRRLPDLEQQVMYWLATEREAVSRSAMQTMTLGIKASLIAPADSLKRRSLIESSGNGYFTLQPVIKEYVTARFVDQIYREIESEKIGLLGSHMLLKAQAREAIRESQERFILTPIKDRLLATHEKAGSEEKLRRLLSLLRNMHPQSSSYAAGNLLNLLIQLKADLRGLDLSHLKVWQAYLQEVQLPEVNFTDANLATSVFNDIFSTILSLAASSDGILLAGGTTSGELRIWRASDMTPLFTCLGHADGIRSVAFSPDNTLLASGSEDQTIRLWQCKTGRCLSTLHGHGSLVRCVAFSPDGEILASASEDQTVRLWDIYSGQCLSTLPHTSWVRTVAFSPDGMLLASGGDDMAIRLWQPDTGACLNTLYGHNGPVRTVAFHPAGRHIASSSNDRTLRIWDVTNGQCLSTLHGHMELVRSMAFSPDGKLLVSGSDDLSIRLWQSDTYECVKVLQGHNNRIWSVVMIPNTKTLVSSDDDEALCLWDLSNGSRLRTLQGRTFLIKAVAFSPDGQRLVSGNEDRALRLWDNSTGQCLALLQGHANRIKAVAFSPDGSTIASASEDESIRLWDADSGQHLNTIYGHSHIVRWIAFNKDGSLLASSSYDQTIRLWDVASSLCRTVLKGHHNQVWSVAFHPDDTQLVSGGEDQTVRLWDIHSGQCHTILHGHEHRVYTVAFSPDGKNVASGSDDQTIRLWDTASGTCKAILKGHTLWVRTLAFSLDGQTLVSGSHDHTVRLWDVNSGHCLKVMRGHSACVWCVAFHPAGRVVASCSDDGHIRLWNVRSGECVKILRNDGPYARMNITGVQEITEAQKAILKTLGAFEAK